MAEVVAKRAVKCTISTVLYGMDWARAVVRRPTGARPVPAAVVLLYHGVAAKEEVRFDRQMGRLAQWAEVVAIEHLDDPSVRRKVAVTFDDALESYAHVAIPVMERRSVPSTVFVPSHQLGGVPAWDGADQSEAVLDRDSVSALCGRVDIGSHSRNHLRMSGLGADALRDEVLGSRADLVALGAEPSWFAFPYGDYDDAAVLAVQNAGYRRAFTVAPEPLSAPGAFLCGRVTVDPSDTWLEFRLKVSGAYRWVGWWMRWKRSRS